MKRFFILLVITSMVLSMRINLEEVPVTRHIENSSNHHGRHHLTNVQQSVNPTEWPVVIPSVKQINDVHLVIPANLGSKEVKLALDTTSYASWVQSDDPRTSGTKCVGCPTDTTVFVCDQKSCTYKNDAPVQTTSSYGFRLTEDFLPASEKSVKFAGRTIKDVNLGLGYKYTPTPANTPATASQVPYSLVKNEGALGLAFGKTYVDYYKKMITQDVIAPIPEVAKDEKFNWVRQLQKQNPALVQAPIFSIKLEETLKLIHFGKIENYFADGAIHEYDNKGESLWQLQVSGFEYGTFSDETTSGAPAEPSTPIVGSVLGQVTSSSGLTSALPITLNGVVDLSSKYFGVSQLFADTLKTGINADQKECLVSITGVLQCKCDDKKAIRGFKNLSLRFNGQRQVHRVKPQNYITYENGICYLHLIVVKPEVFTGDRLALATTFLLIGQSFFYDNYVVFNQETNKVHIANAFQVSPTPLSLNNQYRTAYIVLGSIVALGALILLLSLMKNIKGDFSSVPDKPVERTSQVVVNPVNVPGQTAFYAAQPVSTSYAAGGPVQTRSKYVPQGQAYIR